MKKLTLSDIARVTGGEYIGDASLAGNCITGVVRDSRDVTDGSLFVCIAGAKVDGHSFASKAYGAGASCCLCEKRLENAAGPYILVPSTLTALKQLARYYRGLFDIPVIGIVGSVGKTSAKEMTASVLSSHYCVLKTPENLNNEIGVPLTLLSLREEHEAAVVEMGISDFGEMSRLADMVRPDICVMTNIGYCHLEALGDLDGVLRAKAEVFDFIPKNGIAVVNGDDVTLSSFDPGIRTVKFGYGDRNDVRASDVMSKGFDTVECRISADGSEFSAAIHAFGTHIVLAALAACAVGRELGLQEEEIKRGLSAYRSVGSRANVINTGYINIIDDCYNANPNSMTAALLSLSGASGRKVALLGDMFELGRTEQQLHRGIGVLVAESNIDALICCGRLAEYYYKGLISSGIHKPAWHFPMKEALLSVLPSLIRKGDTVLVKASHGMHFEELTEELKKLS